ncbi:MAG: ArsR/SmtB family transcription factor [Nitrososphaeria archaeon]
MSQSSLDENKIITITKALSHRDRLRIIKILMEAEKPFHIKALTELLKIDYPSMYKHIKMLEKSGIIGIFVVGRSRVPYIKKKEELKKLLEDLVKLT